MMAAARGEKVDGMIQGDLAGSRVVLHDDARPGNPGWPVVRFWPGRRFGEERVGDAITPVGKADRCPPRSQTARSSDEGGVMPADPPPGRRAAQRPERALVPAKGPTETKP